MSELDYKKEALNPKWWLILNALGHTFIGTLLPMDPDNDNELMISGVMLVITVYMLYAAFLTTGRAQARLAAVIAGPIWVWFVVCIALGLEITYTTDGPYTFDFADNVPPLIFWGMTALTGVLGWNMEEE
tara:strand:- start:38418 stop:38807 length:390 start_codon:yes stop_codon:yes gene_type:complete